MAQEDVSDDNPRALQLEPWKTELIDQYKLRGTKLIGDTYSYATVKERMPAAIIATPNNNRGDGLLTLCQLLEAMRQGLAVVTEADLNYIAGQMSTFLYAEESELEGMPVTMDITGDKTLQSGYYNWGKEQQNAVLHMLNAYVTPWTSLGKKNDAALDELTDLVYGGGFADADQGEEAGAGEVGEEEEVRTPSVTPKA